jgi:hypothetical protein
VVQTLRRYILGPAAATPVKLGALQDESVTSADNAARPIELDPDSAAARTAAPDSIPQVTEP